MARKSWASGNLTSEELNNKLTEFSLGSTKEGICPNCGKTFFYTPEHVYKNKKGKKVCSYHCAIQSGGIVL